MLSRARPSGLRRSRGQDPGVGASGDPAVIDAPAAQHPVPHSCIAQAIEDILTESRSTGRPHAWTTPLLGALASPGRACGPANGWLAGCGAGSSSAGSRDAGRGCRFVADERLEVGGAGVVAAVAVAVG
jgi:hypothetical protein